MRKLQTWFSLYSCWLLLLLHSVYYELRACIIIIRFRFIFVRHKVLSRRRYWRSAFVFSVQIPQYKNHNKKLWRYGAKNCIVEKVWSAVCAYFCRDFVRMHIVFVFFILVNCKFWTFLVYPRTIMNIAGTNALCDLGCHQYQLNVKINIETGHEQRTSNNEEIYRSLKWKWEIDAAVNLCGPWADCIVHIQYMRCALDCIASIQMCNCTVVAIS